MKKYNLIFVFAAICLITILTFTIGYAAWHTPVQPVTTETSGDIYPDDAYPLSGVDVIVTKKLTYSKFFFEEEENGEIVNVPQGVLKFKIIIDKDKLDDSITGNSLSLDGDFYFYNFSSQEQMSDTPTLKQLIISSSGITLGQENEDRKVSFKTNSIDITNDTEFEITLTFRNALIPYLQTEVFVVNVYKKGD